MAASSPRSSSSFSTIRCSSRSPAGCWSLRGGLELRGGGCRRLWRRSSATARTGRLRRASRASPATLAAPRGSPAAPPAVWRPAFALVLAVALAAAVAPAAVVFLAAAVALAVFGAAEPPRRRCPRRRAVVLRSPSVAVALAAAVASPPSSFSPPLSLSPPAAAWEAALRRPQSGATGGAGTRRRGASGALPAMASLAWLSSSHVIVRPCKRVRSGSIDADGDAHQVCVVRACRESARDG